MSSEEMKKQYMSSREFFTAKRWEGKPFSFKLKYGVANYPEILLSVFTICLLCPAICAYRYFTFDNSKRDFIQKYKPNYIVVRDDHPEIEKIIKEKESGREFFPK